MSKHQLVNVIPTCIGFRSGVLSEFRPSFHGVLAVAFALHNLFLPGLESGLERLGFRVVSFAQQLPGICPCAAEAG